MKKPKPASAKPQRKPKLVASFGGRLANKPQKPAEQMRDTAAKMGALW